MLQVKTPKQINDSLIKFQDIYKIPVLDSLQGSEAWFNLKLGVISASNASKVVAKRDSDTRLTYMSELVAQVCTGDQEEINSKYLSRGNAMESAAIERVAKYYSCELEKNEIQLENEYFKSQSIKGTKALPV